MTRKRSDADSTETQLTAVPKSADAPELFVFHGERVITLPVSPGSEIVIGRGRGCDITVDHKTVSRRHARVYIEEPPRIEDLGSANGTWIGERRVSPGERAVIAPGQIAFVGAAAVVLKRGSSGIPVATEELPRFFDGDARQTLPPLDREATMPSKARVDRLLKLVARGDISVLLLGETGVGKEVAAESIHAASPRAQAPFLRLNCAALPENLLEAELFGYERGAFTGADRPKPGLLESASRGTVFLDEIGEMPPATQAKLLRTLEHREVMRLGSVQPRTIDVRFVAATNRDLAADVASGSFRRDLYYRLNGVEIVIPPLRERPQEILPLSRGFIDEAAKRLKLPPPDMTRSTEQRLLRHGWPGNIRELRNVIDRAVLLSEGADLLPEHLALGGREGASSPYAASSPFASEGPRSDLRTEVAGFERQRIVDALEKTGGNQTAAAELLGIPRRTLVHKLREHGISRSRK